MLEDKDGDKQVVERCALCDDRFCIQEKNRKICLLDGRMGERLQSIDDCPKRINLQRYLDGEIALEQALKPFDNFS